MSVPASWDSSKKQPVMRMLQKEHRTEIHSYLNSHAYKQKVDPHRIPTAMVPNHATASGSPRTCMETSNVQLPSSQQFCPRSPGVRTTGANTPGKLPMGEGAGSELRWAPPKGTGSRPHRTRCTPQCPQPPFCFLPSRFLFRIPEKRGIPYSFDLPS